MKKYETYGFLCSVNLDSKICLIQGIYTQTQYSYKETGFHNKDIYREDCEQRQGNYGTQKK